MTKHHNVWLFARNLSNQYCSHSPDDRQKSRVRHAAAKGFALVQVHRLDEATGGLLLVAKTRLGLQGLSASFEQRQVHCYGPGKVVLHALRAIAVIMLRALHATTSKLTSSWQRNVMHQCQHSSLHDQQW